MALPPLGRTGLTDHTASAAIRNTIWTKRVANMLDGQALRGRAQWFPEMASFKIELSSAGSATSLFK
jgi:hypothetical protein